MPISLLNGASFHQTTSGIHSIAPAFGSGTIMRTKTTQGIEIINVKATFTKPLYIAKSTSTDYIACTYYINGEPLYEAPSPVAQMLQQGITLLAHAVEPHLPTHIYEGEVQFIEVRYPLAIIEHFIGDGEQALLLRERLQYNGLEQFTNSAIIQQQAHAIAGLSKTSALYAMKAEAQAIDMLATCFGELLQTTSWRMPTKDELLRVKRGYDLLLANIQQPPTLHELAVQTGLTEDELTRFFTQIFGAPIVTLVRAWQMANTIELVANGEITVVEAAKAFGYGSEESTLANAFKKQFGMTPRDYFSMLVKE